MLFISILTVLIQACGSVPILGRKQLLLVPDQEVLTLSLQQYREFLHNAPVEKTQLTLEKLNRLGRELQQLLKHSIETTDSNLNLRTSVGSST